MSEIGALSVSDDQLAGCPAGPGPTTGSVGDAGPDGPQDLDAVGVPLERLEERICELAAHLAAGTCRFLRLVAEFDARRGWACWDLPSCAAWLAWRCQVAPGTAREQVRVARALEGLPVICGLFAAGRMSYAKTRALTRIATPQTEAALAEITGPMTAAQCERFAAAHRAASDAGDVAARAARRVSVQWVRMGRWWSVPGCRRLRGRWWCRRCARPLVIVSTRTARIATALRTPAPPRTPWPPRAARAPGMARAFPRERAPEPARRRRGGRAGRAGRWDLPGEPGRCAGGDGRGVPVGEDRHRGQPRPLPGGRARRSRSPHRRSRPRTRPGRRCQPGGRFRGNARRQARGHG